jgi:hypothetical protein
VAKNTSSSIDSVEPTDTAAGKGRPTPTRREKEAARRRPLVGDRAEARRRMQDERERQRAGLAAGDEKYLPIRDKGPQKRYVRDYIDARFSVGEFLIPMMFVIIVLTFFNDPVVQVASFGLLWLFFAAAVIDALIAGRILTRRLRAKHGDRAERVRWYGAMRAFQLRPLRLPKPQVKRGQYPSL